MAIPFPFSSPTGIFVACLSAFLLHFVLFSSSPFPALQLPSSSSTLPFSSNAKLQEVIKLGEGVLHKPEAVAVDEKGVLYTATRDGWIKRLLENGTWQNWQHVDSIGLLGIATTVAGDIIVCDAGKGLLKVGEDGVTVLLTHVNGHPITFADDVAAASDGKLYFSIASDKYGFHNWYLDMLDPEHSGQLVQFDPSTGTASVLLDHLGFANGVTLSENEDYLIVCETWKSRCLKHVLKGEDRGKTETFIENLPGSPDNINVGPDGSFWIALLQIRPSWWTNFVPKFVLTDFPKVIEWASAPCRKAMVVNVGSNGKMIRGFDDPTGEVMEFVTSAVEFDGNLYLGSLGTDFVGKLPLTTTPIV